MPDLAAKFAPLKTLRDEVLASPHISPHRYDLLLHVTGTEESLYQLHLIRNVLGLRPLTVTFNHRAMSTEEQRRLETALEVFDVDNIRFNPRRSVVERFRSGSGPAGNEKFARAAQSGMLWFSLFSVRMYRVPFLVLDAGMSGFGGSIDDFKAITAEMIGQMQERLALDPAQISGLGPKDLKPYRFGALSSEGIQVAKLGPWFEKATEQERGNFRAQLARGPALAPMKAASGDWHRQPGRRQVSLEAATERKATHFEKAAAASMEGAPLYGNQLRYCVRCCMPETAESLAFDEMGMCQPCRSSEQKMHINWKEREKHLARILDENMPSDPAEYDLVVPISGGKDSTFQLYVLTKKYNRRPLAVTFSHNWYTETGRKNLENACDNFDVDHVIFTPRRQVINKLARKSLVKIGDSCWHCHSGVGAFPLLASARFGVPLLVWGESVSERDGRATYENPIIFDREYFTKISARFYAEQMVDENISLFDVQPYVLPPQEELSEKKVRGIHLGEYIFWDDERQTEFVRDHWGWLEDGVEGAYKGFKSVECRMAGVHDYSKFVKRGFGRGTDQASIDVRTGLLTREEGFELAKKFDTERPEALDFYLQITGYTEAEFESILRSLRSGSAKKIP